MDKQNPGPTYGDGENVTSQVTEPKMQSNGGGLNPPNGGVKAWLQVLGGWFLVFNTMGVYDHLFVPYRPRLIHMSPRYHCDVWSLSGLL